jgi:hypothetical protein
VQLDPTLLSHYRFARHLLDPGASAASNVAGFGQEQRTSVAVVHFSEQAA